MQSLRPQLSPYQQYLGNTLSNCRSREDVARCVEKAQRDLSPEKLEKYIVAARDVWRDWKPDRCVRCHGNPVKFSPFYDHVNAGECLKCNGSGDQHHPAPRPV